MVVHGIGQQRKGETLAEVAEALALTIEESTPSVQVLERGMDVMEPTATATLRIGDNKGNLATWTLKEALWADAFTAPPARAVFLWIARAIPRQARYLMTLLRQSNSQAPAHGFGPVRMGTQLWSQYNSGWTTKLQLGLLAILLLVVSPFLIASGLVFIYLQRLPFRFLHPFDPFLSRVLGDAYRYTTHGMWAASARGIVERAIIEFLEDEEYPIEDLTIVSNSMGCVVAYDALHEGGAVAEAIKRADDEGRRKKITLVTIGSGINQVFAVARRSETYGKAHFCQPLDPVVTGEEMGVDARTDMFEWVDIYARLDLVPAGGLTPEIRAWSGASASYSEVRVTNTDIPYKDHTSYYQNREAVVPRIIRAINGGEEYRSTPHDAISDTRESNPFDGRTTPRKRLNAILRTSLPAVLFGSTIGLWVATSSPEDGFLESFGNGYWGLELALLLAALWIGRLVTAGLMVLATIGFIGGWLWLSVSMFDGAWIWVAASGPWAVELTSIYVTVLWAVYLRSHRDHPSGVGDDTD